MPHSIFVCWKRDGSLENRLTPRLVETKLKNVFENQPQEFKTTI